MDPRLAMANPMANPNTLRIVNMDPAAGGPISRETPIAKIKTPDIDSSRGYSPAFE